MIIGLATNMTFEKEGDDISDGCLYSWENSFHRLLKNVKGQLTFFNFFGFTCSSNYIKGNVSGIKKTATTRAIFWEGIF